MGAVLLGVVALIALLIMGRAFVGADPKLLARALRYAGAGALALAAVGLFLTERPAAAAFIATAAWGLFTGGHVWPGGWPRYGARSASGKGQSSGVKTAWLEMELDHDSGEMRGRVLKGRFAGRGLDDLDRVALAAFYAEADDHETRRLLEAYLLRRLGPGWQADMAGDPPPRAARTGMSREEALKVLGLAEGASADEVRAAHRRLMMQNHPDHGGSDYLASKINEAKDVLLG